MSDLEWFNERLTYYLDQKETRQYKHLIEEVIKSDDIRLKCDLQILLMHHSTQHIVEENLRQAITGFYCTDKDLDTYLDKIVSYNPKFSTISINASHQRDIKQEYSLNIEIPVKYHQNLDEQYKEVDKIQNKIKEVLKMILVESKTIVP